MIHRSESAFLASLAVLAGCLVAATPAQAYTGTLVDQVRQSATKYHDVNVAGYDGYVPATGCVSDESAGVMGVHYVKPTLLGDGALDPMQPEALVYEPLANGKLRLVAVLRMLAVSIISTMNVLSPRTRLSEAPTRVKMRSTTPTRTAAAGTKLPIWAISVMSATCRR